MEQNPVFNATYLAVPTVDGYNLTAGKAYPVLEYHQYFPEIIPLFEIIDDCGSRLSCLAQGCGHLDGADWILFRHEPHRAA